VIIAYILRRIESSVRKNFGYDIAGIEIILARVGLLLHRESSLTTASLTIDECARQCSRLPGKKLGFHYRIWIVKTVLGKVMCAELMLWWQPGKRRR
jgi:hypothetical protein